MKTKKPIAKLSPKEFTLGLGAEKKKNTTKRKTKTFPPNSRAKTLFKI